MQEEAQPYTLGRPDLTALNNYAIELAARQKADEAAVEAQYRRADIVKSALVHAERRLAQVAMDPVSVLRALKMLFGDNVPATHRVPATLADANEQVAATLGIDTDSAFDVICDIGLEEHHIHFFFFHQRPSEEATAVGEQG